MPTKVLLTGASGFLGWNFCKQFSVIYELVGTYFRNQPTDINIQWERINLLETPQISTLIKACEPDIVVHLAAIANTAFCERHPALSHHINVYTTLAIAKASQEAGIPMIFASTDLVFNGNSAPYAEDDFCYPLSQYGLQKQMAEEALLTDFEHVIVARFPLMFGWTPSYTQNFFTSSLAKLQIGETINAFTDEYRSMISAEIASVWLHQLIRYSLDSSMNPEASLLHVGGNASYALKMAAIFELDTKLVIPTLQKDLDLTPARPADVSLNINLAKNTLLYNPPSIEKQLIALKGMISSS